MFLEVFFIMDQYIHPAGNVFILNKLEILAFLIMLCMNVGKMVLECIWIIIIYLLKIMLLLEFMKEMTLMHQKVV